MLPSLALALVLTGITADQGYSSQPQLPAWRVQGSTLVGDSPVVTSPGLGNASAFGEPETVSKVPVVSLDFNYGINSYFVATTTANGGTVTQATSMAVLTTSTANNGSAQIESKAAVRYVAGTGVYASFTALFTTCKASSQQEIGLGDSTDGMFIGCQGATFGMFVRKGGVDSFTALSAASIDHLDGNGPSKFTLTYTNLMVYKISFGWHGSGPIKYFVFDALNGKWILFHVVSANVTAPRVLNPTLPLHAKAVNSGNTTALVLKTASMGAYREGGPSPAVGAVTSAPGAATASKSVTTEAAILTLKDNTSVFSGQVNKVRVKIHQLFLVNASGSTSCTVNVRLNTTLGGAPSFTDFDSTTSVVSTDTAGTTVTGGRLVYSAQVTANVAGGAVATTDLSGLELILNPGDTLTISAASAGAAQTVGVSIVWSERFTG